MRSPKYIIVLVICFLTGCTNKKTETASCIYQKTNKKIETTFPFSQSDRIEIVSYDSRIDSTSDLIRNGRFIVGDIHDLIVLNKPQGDSLFSLLYDYERNKGLGPAKHADCYNPRHSVVFYKAGKAIAFWEICLECGGQRQTADTGFEYFCPENTCRVQDFFVRAGIEDGIIAEQCVPPQTPPKEGL